MANRTVTGPDAPPGAEAERPQEIPKRGWLQIAKRGWAEAQADQVPLLAAGVAFFGFLALFPTLLALVFLYGLIADPSTIAAQIDTLGGALPAEVKDLIVNQLTQQQQQASTGLTVGAALSLAVALWSASGGVTKLVTAVNAAYDESEDRSFVKKRGLALALTLGAIVFMIILIALVAVLPIVFSFFEGGPLRWLVQVARWVLIAGLVMVALAVLYRLAPDRDAPKLRWVSPGAVLATALWLLASFGFSIYVSTFASYAKTYGAIAGIVIVLLWLWLSAYAVLLGAEINAETEQQTIKDSTKGPAQPLGSRGAVKADTVLGEDRSDNANQDLASGRSSSDDDHRHEEGQTVSTHVPAGGASGPSGASAAVSSTGQTTRTVAPTGPADDS
ncbi:MAG: YihY/virulence factor BrkB family protein, partial [Microlunatus sp.]|nr:YihY/virulence factor BrkB family protein [Microlunatus sp.]